MKRKMIDDDLSTTTRRNQSRQDSQYDSSKHEEDVECAVMGHGGAECAVKGEGGELQLVISSVYNECFPNLSN